MKPNHFQQQRLRSPTRLPTPEPGCKTFGTSFIWAAQRPGFILFLFLFFISGERAEVGARRAKQKHYMFLKLPKAHLQKWPGNRSILMTHSTYLAKYPPWARPLSPSLVQLDKAGAPRKPLPCPQVCWWEAQWEAFTKPHGPPWGQPETTESKSWISRWGQEAMTFGGLG